MTPTPPVLIAACGNVTAGDDAFGPMVAEALRRRGVPDADVVCLDLRPAALLDHLPGREALCLVDAACCQDQPPGVVIDFDWFCPHRPELLDDDVLSTHGLSIADQLALADALGILPQTVRLVAATVAPSEHGGPASIDLHRLVDVAVRRIVAFARSRRPGSSDLCHA